MELDELPLTVGPYEEVLPFLYYVVGEWGGREPMNRQTAFPGHCENWMQNVQHFLYADFTLRCEAGKTILLGSLCWRREYA